tara:strand:+ start:934 stop:1878 length:945 start_codon:yes stop_codon:yes gene_type:complete
VKSMGEAWSWTREVLLAGGLIATLIAVLVLMTGSWPPMVVIESSSMMHDPDGEVGAIDPGDLVLVMSPDRAGIVSFVESTEEGGSYEGYESHGKPGDVIIYKKNGGNMTPVIHRVILKAVAEQTVSPERNAADPCIGNDGSWDPISVDSDGLQGTCVLTWSVPGTNVTNVTKINLVLDYLCFNGQNLTISDWDPGHAGYLTSGDNLRTNGCNVDQYAAVGETTHTWRGLTDEHGQAVTAVRDDWVVGVASSEIPWVGAVKLGLSNNSDEVPGSSWTKLLLSAVVLLAIPAVWEKFANQIMETSPEVDQARAEEE